MTMRRLSGSELFRSPLRGRWLTAVLGLVLLAGFTLIALTGFASHAAYEPRLPGNATNPGGGLLDSWLVSWPTSPVWLYRVNQGVHVILGLALVPVVLVKLWSVMPRLFGLPPVRSLAHGLERLSVLLLVGSTLFEMVTGVLNIQVYYAFPFSFYTAHYYGAWVFVAALILHVGVKTPTVWAALRAGPSRSGVPVSRGGSEPRSDAARDDLFRDDASRKDPSRSDPSHSDPSRGDPSRGDPSRSDEDSLAPAHPGPASLSRRGLLGAVAGASVTVVALSVGQTLDGPLRQTALLAPRGRSYGDGPNDFEINKTAAAAGIDPAVTGSEWRLQLTGAQSVQLSRDELLALPQHTYRLPISCVEGWSTEQSWTGVRLTDLARLAGIPDAGLLTVDSLQPTGPFRTASFSARQVADPRSLLALRVNGADLSADHGFPARIIVPAAPGVHCTKWVAAMNFQSRTFPATS